MKLNWNASCLSNVNSQPNREGGKITIRRLRTLTGTVVLLVLVVFALALPIVAEVQRFFKYRVDIPVDWYLTPSEFPCLTETIHATFTLQEYANIFVNPSSGVHFTVHQTTKDATAVGLTTGETYQFSGPLTFTLNGATDAVEVVEFTFHNINHFVGRGGLTDIYLRTLTHVTFDPATGQTKVEVNRDDVLCH